MPKKMTNPAVFPVVLHAMQLLVIPTARVLQLTQQQARCKTHMGVIYSNTATSWQRHGIGVGEPLGAHANLLLGSMAPF